MKTSRLRGAIDLRVAITRSPASMHFGVTLCSRSPPGPAMTQSGGLLSFAGARANGDVAPIADLPTLTPERGGPNPKPPFARRRTQHFQPSTPSRLALDAPDFPSRGGGPMAECDRGSVIAHLASRLVLPDRS